MNTEPCERSIRQVREHLADVINDAVQGRITYVTSNGRRVAAIVPLATTEARAVDDALQRLPPVSLYVTSAEAAAFAFRARSEAVRAKLADGTVA